MLDAVANTSAASHNVQRKSADSLTNRRHRIIRPVSSSLADDKETNGGETRADCVQDYSPCSCSVVSYDQISVVCGGVSVETVRDVFQRVNYPEIYSLDFYPLDDDETNTTISLPADFLGKTTVTSRISINCSYSSDDVYPHLVIDHLAFYSSQNNLTIFTVAYCHFGLQKDFNFLNGFNRLEELGISRIFNITAFQYLPPLPSLQRLFLQYCSDLNQIAFPDLTPAQLKNLFLWENEISEEKADEIFAKLVASTSADSIKELDLYRNSLTRIPSQVGSAFTKLKKVDIEDWNSISHISSSSLTFVSPYLKDLYLYSNGIKAIESGAFLHQQFVFSLV